MSVDAGEHAAHSLSAPLAVEESSDSSLDLDRSEVLGCHRTTPRLLNNPSLRDSVLPLEIWCQSLSLIPSVDPGRFTNDRIRIALASFDRAASRHGVPHLNLIGTGAHRFIILLLLQHAESPRGFANVLQVLGLHHDLLLVRFGTELHGLFDRLGLWAAHTM